MLNERHSVTGHPRLPTLSGEGGGGEGGGGGGGGGEGLFKANAVNEEDPKRGELYIYINKVYLYSDDTVERPTLFHTLFHTSLRLVSAP